MLPLGLALIGLTGARLFRPAGVLPLLDGGCRRGGLILGGLWLQDSADGAMQPDPLIHQPVRLKIMSALKALPDREMLEFVRLKTLVGATEGNLGAHIGSLEQAGYIEVAKDFHRTVRAHAQADARRGGALSRTTSPS